MTTTATMKPEVTGARCSRCDWGPALASGLCKLCEYDDAHDEAQECRDCDGVADHTHDLCSHCARHHTLP